MGNTLIMYREACAQARDRANRTGEACTVFVSQGLSVPVWYVRTYTDGEPHNAIPLYSTLGGVPTLITEEGDVLRIVEGK